MSLAPCLSGDKGISSASGRRSSTSRTKGNGTSCRRITPSRRTHVRIDKRGHVLHNLKRGHRVAVPVDQVLPLDFDFHGTNLTRERIDHLRLPPLTDMEAGKSIERAQHILDHAPRLVGDRHFLVENLHRAVRDDFHLLALDLALDRDQGLGAIPAT